MKLNVVYYGRLKEETGVREETLELDVASMLVGELGEVLEQRYPQLRNLLETVAYAVDDTLVAPDHVLTDGDQAALLPPVSGG